MATKPLKKKTTYPQLTVWHWRCVGHKQHGNFPGHLSERSWSSTSADPLLLLCHIYCCSQASLSLYTKTEWFLGSWS